MTSLETIQILVLQSTGFCNIDCSYCYLPDRDAKGRMGADVLERVSEAIIGTDRWASDSLVLWHAGEPMSCGVDWYDSAHRTLAGSGRLPLRIQFQSNGTLLDQRWTDFLKASGSWLGLSLDGPRSLHDLHRRDRRGAPTFDQVMKSVDLLRRERVPFTTISVVTSKSLDRPDEIFDFFYHLRPEKVAFSIEEGEGANAQSSLYQTEMIEKVERFFHRIAFLNFQQPDPIHIREVDNVLTGLMKPPGRNGRSQETQIGWIVAVGTTGEVALFSPELLTTRQADGHYALVGNILNHSLEEIMAGPRATSQADKIAAGVAMCEATCRYFQHCGGGSPANKYFETQRFDVSETWYCRLAKKAIVRGVMSAIVETGKGRP